MTIVRTIGHGTATAADLAALLTTAGVEALIDVRRYPGSRRHPQFSEESMAGWLPDHGIEYAHLPSLGGRRKLVPGSPNIGLRNEQFRAYADHMATEEFADSVQELLGAAATQHVAVLCSESVWWRCHRRLLADHLILVHGVAVEHLFHDGRITRHDPTAEGRRADDHVVYDVGASPDLFDATD